MPGSSFAIDEFATLLVLLFSAFCYLLYRLKKQSFFPQIYVSTLVPFKISKKNWKERFSNLPDQLKLIALSALLLAIIDPRFYMERYPGASNSHLPNQDKLATEGIALYLVLDQSGSMDEKIDVRSSKEYLEPITKIGFLKRATEAFIKGDPAFGLSGRPHDLLGIVQFARTAQVIVPLTLDRKTLLNKLSAFNIVQDPDQDGTAIGYALLKTAHLIVATKNYARDLIGQGKPAYEIKGAAIILVTDGMQDPNPLDIDSRWRQMDPREAAAYAKEQGIRVYIINVEPKFASEKFAPNRRQMQSAAELTGGKFFLLGSSTNLTSIYSEIDSLEKSSVPIQGEVADALKKKLAKENLPEIYTTYFLAPFLIALALVCLMLAVVLESTLLRRVP
ncbi:MAG: VWA domain-containing protein [Parachlamydiaceae bacterium]|nr:VWA domain-containing protein [Parachlamydiaceae bacterium]